MSLTKSPPLPLEFRFVHLLVTQPHSALSLLNSVPLAYRSLTYRSSY
jgi:hypothetical protein